eukprot:scaffold75877_cov48-Phaeocystis_antarctica.AAC.1
MRFQWERPPAVLRTAPLDVPPLARAPVAAAGPATGEDESRPPRPAPRAIGVPRRCLEEALHRLRVASRASEDRAEEVVSPGLTGLEGDGLAEDLVCPAVLLGNMTRGLCHQLQVLHPSLPSLNLTIRLDLYLRRQARLLCRLRLHFCVRLGLHLRTPGLHRT